MKHLLCLNDLTSEEIIGLIDYADKLKYEHKTESAMIIFLRARHWE